MVDVVSTTKNKDQMVETLKACINIMSQLERRIIDLEEEVDALWEAWNEE